MKLPVVLISLGLLVAVPAAGQEPPMLHINYVNADLGDVISDSITPIAELVQYSPI